MLSLLNSIGTTSNNKGTFVPPPPASIDNFIVILAGQSNMIGRDTGAGEATDPNILMLSRTGLPASETLITAQDPLTHSDAGGGSVGMGMTFAHQLLAANPASNIVLVPAARGSSGFSGTGAWNVGQNDYADALERINKAVSLVTGTYKIIILWHQGEKDGAMSEADYSARLFNMVSRLRNEITGANATTPFICGDTLGTQPATGGARLTLEDVESTIPYSGFANAIGLTDMGDSVHFDVASIKTLGQRYYDQYNGGLSAGLSMSAANAVTDLAAVAGDTNIALSWTAPSNNGSAIVNYIIEYKLSADSVWTEFLHAGHVSTTTSVTVTGLTNDSAYDFRVKAVNAAGIALVSNTATETPVGVSGGARAPANNTVAGAVIDLSARNSNCYDGTQTDLINLGSGVDFWLGTDGTVEADIDPVFTGTAGDAGAYFRLGSPNGRRFTAKAAHTLTNNLHRSDSTTPFSILFQLTPTSSYRVLFATTQHSGGNGGVIFWTTGNTFRVRLYNGAGSSILSWNMTTTFDITANTKIAFTYDPVTGAYQFKVNGETLETGTQTWTNTAVIDQAPVLMTDTDSQFGFDQTTTILDDFIMYDKVLTATEIDSLFTMLSTSKT